MVALDFRKDGLITLNEPLSSVTYFDLILTMKLDSYKYEPLTVSQINRITESKKEDVFTMRYKKSNGVIPLFRILSVKENEYVSIKIDSRNISIFKS